jgi:hypothetical protein
MLEHEHSESRYSENRYSENGTPRWHLRVEEDGQLTAVLSGSQPPVRVSGASLANIHRQIRNAMLRGLI